MKLFRNPEVIKVTILYAIVSLVATIGAFLWEPDFGIFTLALCIVLVGIYINSTYQRYKRLTELASDINRILHGDDIGISLEQYAENSYIRQTQRNWHYRH